MISDLMDSKVKVAKRALPATLKFLVRFFFKLLLGHFSIEEGAMFVAHLKVFYLGTRAGHRRQVEISPALSIEHLKGRLAAARVDLLV